MPFVKQTFFMDLFQCPPFRFNIIIIIGDIGVLHIRPVANTFGKALPLIFILPDTLFAFLDKVLHAICFDLFLTIQPQLLFHFQLYGQTMGIPARFTQYVVAIHRFIAREEVFNAASQNMADMRFAIGCGWPVIKRIIRFPFALFLSFFKNVLFLPELQNLFFSLDKVQVGRDFLIHLYALLCFIIVNS